MASPKKLKLFVWENVLCDYSCGIICILAHDEAEARQVWETSTRKHFDYLSGVIAGLKPKAVTKPAAFWVSGGG